MPKQVQDKYGPKQKRTFDKTIYFNTNYVHIK